jgi:ABC-2 type transport system permease protein
VYSNPAAQVAFHSEDAALSRARGWLQRALNDMVRLDRLQDQGMQPAVVMRATLPVDVEARGLFELSADGEILPAEKPDRLMSVFLPLGIMMLMFVVILMAAQPMLESVIEEKSERIAEVLLGCVQPQELMLGKLLGNVGGSLSTFLLYALGGMALVYWKGLGDKIPFQLLPAFVVYQVLGVLFFSSIFMAVGASVNSLKEAQSLLLPVWMLLCMPMFVLFNALTDPNSGIALWLSFFPPSAPLMSVLRVASGAAIPVWQQLGSVLSLVVSTVLVVIAGGRIFRVGILWQGKSPSLPQMLKWIIVSPTG